MRFFSMVMSIAVRTTVPPFDTVEPLRREVTRYLYEVRTMEQLARASLARQRFLLLQFGVFAGLALALASIGIYGVLSYLAGLRVPECGVRMALGATARDVLRLVFRQSAGMILVGIVFGSVGALATARLLQRIVVGMRPANPTTLAI
jgi:ABC-type antimicrobial peptide transport system permease subunit